MSGNLKTIAVLQDEVETAGYRGITGQDLIDTLQSLSKVGGCLNVNDPADPFTLSAGRNRVDAFDKSVDTQGVKDGLNDATDPGGWYEIKDVGAGDYTVSSSIRFSADQEGEYKIEIGVLDSGGNNVSTPYVDAVLAPANATVTLNLSGCIIKNITGGMKLFLNMRGVNGANVTVYHGQFGIWR